MCKKNKEVNFMLKLIYLFKNIYKISRWLAYNWYRYVTSKPPFHSEQFFIDQNTAFWRQFFSQENNKHTGYTLVEFSGNPYLLHYIVSIAVIASRIKRLKPLIIAPLPFSVDSIMRKILRSYEVNIEVVTIGMLRYVVFGGAACWLANEAFHKLSSLEDVLQFHVDGIEFGDLIYDDVLSDGYATLSAVDERVFQKLWSFFFYRFIINYVLKHYVIKDSFLIHTIGIRNGTFARYLLERNIQVTHCRCVAMTNIKKYSSLKEIRQYPLRPELKYVDYMIKNQLNRIIAFAEEYLDRRFNQGFGGKDPAVAFNPSNRTYRSKEEFAEQYNLDAKRKNIFVMLHAFNDYPHMLGIDSILYRDYYEWFINTLRVAKSVSAVNWIFKEHPSAKFYITRDLDLNTLFGTIDKENIVFLNRDADFNARSLRYLADTVVTCIGTAGLEYSSLGIPCILGGKSPYSGFGFTIEAQDRTEYEQLLRHIDHLRPLRDEQVQMAKVIMYFQLYMGLNAPFFLMPQYKDYKQIRHIKDEKFWRDAADRLKELNKDEIERNIEKLKRFIINDFFTQYIDFDIYNFMRGALDYNISELVGEKPGF